jgi:ferric-dicitrate binding protein FerR (iron transport regulator)
MEESKYYKQLVERYSTKKASDEELIVFFKLVNDGVLDEYLADSFREDDVIDIERKTPRAKIISGKWMKAAIAAAIIGIVATAVVFLFFNERHLQKSNDIAAATHSPSYKIITTRGGDQRNLILPDGTKIWLNAVSSIRYPETFSGNERIVELEGECYFEVAHNSSIPFRVKTNGGVEIQVTGTHFNIYAYSNEPVKATLLEGAIRVQSDKQSAVLKPGQQALIKKAGLLEISNADVEEAMAWRNGILQFNRADVPTVMRQIERWYDVDVVYEGTIPEKEFVGKIPQKNTIQEVLQILELNGIDCRIEGRKITVLR